MIGPNTESPPDPPGIGDWGMPPAPPAPIVTVYEPGRRWGGD